MRLPILDLNPSPSAMWFDQLGPDARTMIAADVKAWARIAGSAARACRMYSDAVDTGQMRIVEIRVTESADKWGNNVFCTVNYNAGTYCSALAGHCVDGRMVWTCYAD